MSRLDRDVVARLLRQRLELGGDDDLFLEGLDRASAIELARAARAGTGAPRRSDGPSARSESDSREAAGPSARPASKESPRETERRSAPASPASGGASDSTAADEPCPPDPELPDDYEALRQLALGCTRCGLSETRTQVVFSDGNPKAKLMVVGEAPGANEDATGLPFVGVAGKFLDLLLATVGLSREENVYICNVLKCRPPGNRNPQTDEIACCSPYLRKQIELVKPEAILAVGTFAAQTLTGQSRPLGKLRGSPHSYEGVPLVVTYHPAALLRNAGWTEPTWDDLQLLREILDGE